MKTLFLLLTLISFGIFGCSSGSTIVKNDELKVSALSEVKLSPILYKTELEWKHKSGEKELETFQINCQDWTMLFLKQVKLDKDGKICSTSYFTFNNIITQFTPGSFGEQVFKYFCIDK